MKAVVKENPQKGIACMELPKPSPKADEILIEVRAAAICGTDINYYLWNAGAQSFAAQYSMRFPQIIGHEVCGLVVEIGKDVRNVKVGDKVALETHIYCGKCYQCMNNEPHNCSQMDIFGCSCDGGFAEYAVAPAKMAFALPDSVSFETGCLFEPAGVAMRAVEESGLVQGDIALVFGAGPIGLFAIQILKASGAAKVIAVDLDDFRLDMARRLGAVAINSSRENLVERVAAETKAHGGADVILEMTGAGAIYRTLFDCLRKEGHVVTVGHAPDVTINISQFNAKGTSIKGVFGRHIWRTWLKLLGLVEQDRIHLSDVITHRFAWSQCEEAFEQTGKGAGKVLFVR